MRKTGLKLILLLAAAAILPSCRHDHTDWVWVTVDNQGTHSVQVAAEAEYWSGFSWDDHADLWVDPGQSVGFRFRLGSLTHLRVRIYRSTDLLKIFDETWDRGDLDDVDDRVFISIAP
ncbi:MAG: hypothetical protein HY293_03780 [Planctomycetes bacterium]|nr:hypothetical protein [Planctomycetota bacterium]